MKRRSRRLVGLAVSLSTVGSLLISAPAALAVTTAYVSAGAYHTCAVTTAGAAKCWGQNWYGQLGNGNTVDSTVPASVSGLGSGVTDISAGLNHTCAVVSGAAKCWGANYTGGLGTGDQNATSVPAQVSGLSSGIAKIGAGLGFSCALNNSGGVLCWGYNYYGQLGNGTTDQSDIPVAVTGLSSGVTSISVGESHACAVLSSGTLKCWGYNEYGQLGDGTVISRQAPVTVATGIASVSAGVYNGCAVTTAGALKCWGDNSFGQVGNGTYTQALSPAQVSGLSSGVSSAASGESYSCALTTAGAVKCWGQGDLLGDGTSQYSLTPVSVANAASGQAYIEAGKAHTCAVTTVSYFRCWGYNGYGQIGDNSSNNVRLSPVWVYGLAGPLTYQPDATISVQGSATVLGGDIYNTTGTGQTLSKNMSAGGTAYLELSVQNDGNASDNFTVLGDAGNSDFTVTYLEYGYSDVTTSVTAGSYQAGLGQSETSTLTVQIIASLSAVPGSAFTFSMTATSASDTSKKDTVKATVAVAKIWKPDASIQDGSSYYGDGTYNATGNYQTAQFQPSRGSTTTIRLKIQNDGNTDDTYSLKGPASATGFTVHYFKGTTDITSLVTAGTYSFPAATASTTAFTATVKVGSSISAGAKFTMLITAKSAGDTSKLDAVKAIVTAAAALWECVDQAYVLEGAKWTKTYQWYIKTSTIPGALSKDAAISSLKKAANNITSSRNACGLSDQVSATNRYLGATSKSSSLCSEVSSGQRDGYNVISFGNLGATGIAGITCYIRQNGVMLEADMVLNTYYDWTTSNPVPCKSNPLPIEQVATHEFGHVYGLGHPSRQADVELTMYPILSCQQGLDASALGLGDVLGLRKLY